MPTELAVLEQKIPIPAPPPGTVTIDVVFNVARARILPSPAIEFDGFSREVDSRAPNNVVRLKRPNPMPAGEADPRLAQWRGIVVQGQGERPELVKIVFRGGRAPAPVPLGLEPQRDQVLAVYSPAPGVCVDDADYLLKVAPTGPNVGPVATTLDPNQYVSDLDAALKTAPDSPTTRYRRYFAALNRQTHPDLIETLPDLSSDDKDLRRKAISWLTMILNGRLANRAKELRDHPKKVWTSQVNPSDPVQQLSDIQLKVADDCLGRNGGPCDHSEFQEAFEMFANGQLRYQLPGWAWTTQPTSGFFFYFAEFALLAMDQGIAADRWRPLAPALVRAQHVFARVFQPGGPNPPGIGDYSGCNYDPLRTYSASELKKLRTQYPYRTEKSLRRGAAANALKYLPALVQ